MAKFFKAGSEWINLDYVVAVRELDPGEGKAPKVEMVLAGGKRSELFKLALEGEEAETILAVVQSHQVKGKRKGKGKK